MADFPHVVVVIPGIMGSVLEKDGYPIWGFDGGTLLNAARSLGGKLARLSLDAQGSLDEEIGDGIAATRLLTNIEVIPGLWRLGGYTDIERKLVPQLGLRPGLNYFPFPYDWRRDNRVAATRLARVSMRWLNQWRERSGNDEAKLVLVAHSMGGLVARHFVECQEGWRSTAMVINVGVPFRGSGNALDMLSNRMSHLPLPEPARAAIEAAATFDSTYQLLPSYPFLTEEDGRLVRVRDVDVPAVDRGRAISAARFLDEMTDARRANERTGGREAVMTWEIVGIQQPTLQSASRGAGGRLLLAEMETDGVNHAGDGTVPRVSAQETNAPDAPRAYVANAHAALASDQTVYSQIAGIFTAASIDPRRYRAAGDDYLWLKLPDVVLAGGPLRILAGSSRSPQYIDATVTADGRNDGRTVRLFRSDRKYETELVVPAGSYCVRVSTHGVAGSSDVPDVSDVVMVI